MADGSLQLTDLQIADVEKRMASARLIHLERNRKRPVPWRRGRRYGSRFVLPCVQLFLCARQRAKKI